MKKLLAILGAVGLTATAGTAVVACGTKVEFKTEYKGLSSIKASSWKGEQTKLPAEFITTTDEASFIKAVGAVIASSFNKNELKAFKSITSDDVSVVFNEVLSGVAKTITFDDVKTKVAADDFANNIQFSLIKKTDEGTITSKSDFLKLDVLSKTVENPLAGKVLSITEAQEIEISISNTNSNPNVEKFMVGFVNEMKESKRVYDQIKDKNSPYKDKDFVKNQAMENAIKRTSRLLGDYLRFELHAMDSFILTDTSFNFTTIDKVLYNEMEKDKNQQIANGIDDSAATLFNFIKWYSNLTSAEKETKQTKSLAIGAIVINIEI
ncbi:lipoprotein [[Acholeplasma] multilocale]|uniref:lipoprotein n=1 Tax=[Acholeplasma] multilocale TaxID=264638 RepID=UPI00047D3BFD|nr:lipoprotein [[Acholeplasma] multilocale]